LNHSLLLSTYYFFCICYTTPNDLKFFKHVYNLAWRMNPKSDNHFGYFSYHCDLGKCCCPVHMGSVDVRFFTGPKWGCLSIQTLIYIFQSTRWKFLKCFSPLLKLAYYKILRFDVSENISFLKFGPCTRSVSFGALLLKTQSNTFRS